MQTLLKEAEKNICRGMHSQLSLYIRIGSDHHSFLEQRVLTGPIVMLLWWHSLSFSLFLPAPYPASLNVFLRIYFVSGKICSEIKCSSFPTLSHSSNFLQMNIPKIPLFYDVSLCHLGSCLVYADSPPPYDSQHKPQILAKLI